MKTIYRLICVLFLLPSLFSCEEGEIVSGAPDSSKEQFITLEGTVSTPIKTIVPGQRIPLTITLPQSFPVDVNVEVTSQLTNINRRTRKSFLIRAGLTTITDVMTVPSGDQAQTFLPFNNVLDVFLTAITTGQDVEPKGFPGIQYSLTSNILTLDYGDSPIGAIVTNRFVARLDWPGPYNTAGNNLNIVLKKDGVAVIVANANSPTSPIYGTTSSQGNVRGEILNFLPTAEDGVYTVEAYAIRLMTSPFNMPYRFTFRLPDESTFSLGGTINNLEVGTAATATPILQITKTTVGSTPQYEMVTLM